MIAAVAAAALFLGCPYFSNGVFTEDISSRRVAPRSTQYIKASISAGGGGGFNLWVPTQEKINEATATTSLVAVRPAVRWHRPPSPVPWDPSFYIEPLTDHHSMVLQSSACRYYEGYGTIAENGMLREYNGSVWDLKRPYVRPQTGALSTASGIPIGLLAVRPEELAAGVISHALGWAAVAHSVSQMECVAPAGLLNCTDRLVFGGPVEDEPFAMPYGAHIRLKSSVDISSFPREAQIVATALMKYGAYLFDTGCCNAIPAVDDRYGAPVWSDEDKRALATITLEDFEVVLPPDVGPVSSN